MLWSHHHYISLLFIAFFTATNGRHCLSFIHIYLITQSTNSNERTIGGAIHSVFIRPVLVGFLQQQRTHKRRLVYVHSFYSFDTAQRTDNRRRFHSFHIFGGSIIWSAPANGKSAAVFRSFHSYPVGSILFAGLLTSQQQTDNRRFLIRGTWFFDSGYSIY